MADANRIAAALRYQQDMEGPVTMNPNIAEQGRKGRANMAPPTSVMDPRSRDYERRSRETENFLIGADILAGALPFAPLAKGAVMAAGRYATPKVMQGMENYMGRTGMTLNAAPQDEALRLAQQRAALPVKQGGLGLPADNTPQQRAAAMGFDKTAYHATDADILAFDNAKLGTNTASLTGGDKNAIQSAMQGHWFSDRDLTNKDPRGYMFGDVSYPVKLENPKIINDKEFQSKSFIVKDPDNIRSRFAAFDPFRRNKALAAALGVAAPDLLAEEK